MQRNYRHRPCENPERESAPEHLLALPLSRDASTYLRRIRNIANLHKHGRERISTRTSARLAPTSTCGGSGILLIDLVYKFLKIYHHILLNLASPDYCKRNTKASAPRRAVALYTPRRARFRCRHKYAMCRFCTYVRYVTYGAASSKKRMVHGRKGASEERSE